jgi:hypothetical protein
MRLLRIAGLFLWGAVSMCLVGCDGVVQVEGSAASAAGEPLDDCTAMLFRSSDDRRMGRRRVSDSNSFLASFTVFPWKREYYVEVTCDGYSTYRSDPFTSRARLGDPPIELGRIELDPETSSGR